MTNSDNQLVFYPVYCDRCYLRSLLKSIDGPCPRCGKTDRMRCAIKEEAKLELNRASQLNQLRQQRIKAQQQVVATITRLEKSINDLRLFVKYQTFDLEATRRENAVLKKKLEDNELL